MTKFEFLGDLSRLIADLPQDEREQAMDYYEDYFADAGPEKEQEIIRDFISPAYIAEQLREASERRQRMSGNQNREPKTGQSAPQTAAYTQANPQPVSQAVSQPTPQSIPQTVSRPAPQPIPQAVSQPAPQPIPQTVSQPAPQPIPQTVSQPTPQPMPQAAQQTASVSATEMPVTAAAAAAQSEASAMRTPIFQQNSQENSKEAEEALALRRKTKIDIKTINATTSKVDKKQARAAAKQAAAEEKKYTAELYSGPKKAVLAALLIITCPISLSILAVIIGLFLLVIGVMIGFVLLGIGSIVVSIVSLLLCILSLVTMHIPNCVFTLGSALLLFSAGIGICYADFKLATRAIPSAYFNLIVLFQNVKAALARFTLK